ncbi:DUF4143 domain-containing protein [Georgenia sp.]
MAGQTAQVLNATAAANDVGIDPHAARDYVWLLESVFLNDLLPAGGTTLASRSANAPKLHVLDSGVAGRLLRLAEAGRHPRRGRRRVVIPHEKFLRLFGPEG